MFTIDNELYHETFNSVYASEIELFNDGFQFADNEIYYLEDLKKKTLQKINKLNSEYGGLGQYMSYIKNELEKNRRIKSIDLIKDFCSKGNYNLGEIVKKIAEIDALYSFYDIIAKKQLTLIKNKNANLKISNEKLITVKPEKISVLHKELKTCFDNSESLQLLNLLKGKGSDTKITFLFNANRFVELFQRLHYNGYIFNNKAIIKHWIVRFFNFKNELNEDIKPFNINSVHATLYGVETAQPKKTQRILLLDWLPYISPEQLKKAKKA